MFHCHQIKIWLQFIPTKVNIISKSIKNITPVWYLRVFALSTEIFSVSNIQVLMATPPLFLSFTPINSCTPIRRHEIKITLGAKTAGTFCTTGSVCRTQSWLRSLVVKRCTTGSVCRTQNLLRSFVVKRCTTGPVCRTQNLLRSLFVKHSTTGPVCHSKCTGFDH